MFEKTGLLKLKNRSDHNFAITEIYFLIDDISKELNVKKMDCREFETLRDVKRSRMVVRENQNFDFLKYQYLVKKETTACKSFNKEVVTSAMFDVYSEVKVKFNNDIESLKMFVSPIGAGNQALKKVFKG